MKYPKFPAGWQAFLNTQGFRLTVDGKPGPATDRATKAFQTAHGLRPDGIVGPNTIATAKEKGFLTVVEPVEPPKGIISRLTSLVTGKLRAYTDAEVLKRVETHARGFDEWKDGWYEIFIRAAADKYDEFDDVAFTYQVIDGVPHFRMRRTVTTNAGSFGLLHFDTYNPLGCAVLQSDRFVRDSYGFGFHKFKKNNPCYRQIKSWFFYRDGNRNKRAEEIGEVFFGIIGANIHRVRGFARWIKNWSVACLVTQSEKEFDAWLDMMVKAGKPLLSVAILKEF